jgi:PAS domain S-box-containing protein
MEGAGVGLAACDAEGRLTLLSPVLQELFGTTFVPLPEAEHPKVFDLLTEDGTPVACRDYPLRRARRGEYVRDEILTTHRAADGSLAQLRCNAAPLHDREGHPDGAVALVQDVTDERTVEETQELMRRQLLEAVNHEFRTPLAALLGHVQLLLGHRDELPHDMVFSLEAIERNAWRLRDLVRGVTDLVDRAGHPN